jgi:hypothetical protein
MFRRRPGDGELGMRPQGASSLGFVAGLLVDAERSGEIILLHGFFRQGESFFG